MITTSLDFLYLILLDAHGLVMITLIYGYIGTFSQMTIKEQGKACLIKESLHLDLIFMCNLMKHFSCKLKLLLTYKQHDPQLDLQKRQTFKIQEVLHTLSLFHLLEKKDMLERFIIIWNSQTSIFELTKLLRIEMKLSSLLYCTTEEQFNFHLAIDISTYLEKEFSSLITSTT